MSFGQKRFGNAGRGRGGSGGGFRNGQGGRGGGRKSAFNDQGPPDRVIPLGYFDYVCEDDIICKVEIEDVPYFNAAIFLENKEQIGKIDEIFGTVRDYSVSVKLAENLKAGSFNLKQKLFIDPNKLLSIARFLPKTTQSKGVKKTGINKTSGGRGGGRGKTFNNGFRGRSFGGGDGKGFAFNKKFGGGGGSGRGRGSGGGGGEGFKKRW